METWIVVRMGANIACYGEKAKKEVAIPGEARPGRALPGGGALPHVRRLTAAGQGNILRCDFRKRFEKRISILWKMLKRVLSRRPGLLNPGGLPVRIQKALLVTLSFILPASAGAVELGFSSISLNAGYIEHFYRDEPKISDIYAFYPEILATGPLFASYLHWGLAWGIWDDGIERPFTEDNEITYSFQSQILGIRIMFRPRKTGENWALPVGIFAGYSHHFIRAEYVGGLDAAGKPGRNARRSSNTFEIGLNMEFPVSGPFILRGEVRQYIPFSGDDFEEPQKSRRAYTFGAGYRL